MLKPTKQRQQSVLKFRKFLEGMLVMGSDLELDDIYVSNLCSKYVHEMRNMYPIFRCTKLWSYVGLEQYTQTFKSRNDQLVKEHWYLEIYSYGFNPRVVFDVTCLDRTNLYKRIE